MDIDLVRLNLNQNSINVLQLIIAIIMFGVALDLKLSDFVSILKRPKNLILGLLNHYLIFPLLTYLTIILFNTRPSISLGLAMVAICPGGNLANLFTHLSKGNTAISVGLTSFTTLFSIFTMPIGLIYLGKFIPGADVLLGEISIRPSEILFGVLVVLALPLLLGMLISKILPNLAARLRKVMSKISVVFLLIFIIGALAANYQHFLNYIHMIVGVVLIHNLLAVSSSYIIGKLMGSSNFDILGMTFPISVKNTALGLALVFQFFHGMGGMALIVAWWGITQIIMGLIISNICKIYQKKVIS